MTAQQSERHRRIDALLPQTETPLRAEVFVHSLAPVGSKQKQERLLADLERLVEHGRLRDLELTVWGDSICTEGTLSSVGAGERIVSAIGDFFALASATDLSISPFFRISTVQTDVANESFRRIVPSSCCVAVYAAEDLVGVFPSLIDGVAYTPTDLVEYLAAETPTPLRSVADE